MKINFKVIIGAFLVLISFILGIIFIIIGVKGTYQQNQTANNYLSADGYYVDYEIYDIDEDGITYRLIYRYQVDGKEYQIKTDYGTNYIPDANDIREVKYNPQNPEQAILTGTTYNTGLIFFGIFFTAIPLVFILAALTVLGYFDKLKIDVVGTFAGIVILVIGIGMLMLQNGETGSPTETIQSFGIWIIVPFLFIVGGVFQIIKCLIIKSK